MSRARACAVLGCPNTTPCPDHARVKQWDRARGSAAARGYTSRWAKVSHSLRSRELRWCGDRMPGSPETTDSQCSQHPLQRVPSNVVDHIQPVSGPNDPKFWDKTNWQGLCHRCHNVKRQRERGAVA